MAAGEHAGPVLEGLITLEGKPVAQGRIFLLVQTEQQATHYFNAATDEVGRYHMPACVGMARFEASAGVELAFTPVQ